MNFQKTVFVIALVWYAITAYFSIGYIHADEHYQILEFAEYIDGVNTSKDLAWEFEARLRPATQPIIAYFVIKITDFLSIDNPYNKALFLRLLTTILSVLTILLFTNSVKKWVHKQNWKLFLLLSYFIWFLPFINVRFSSETWSGLSFLIAVSLLIRNKRKNYNFLLIGAILGLSFLFRYQIALAVIGLLAWLLFIRKEKFINLVLIAVSGLSMVLLGFFIDSWFYGEWVFVFWNYLYVNLVEGVAASFGTRPWYHYFLWIGYYAIPPIGLMIFLSLITVIYKKPKNIIIWIVVPFILVHSLIAHKELRFLFPIVNFVPIIFVLFIQSFDWKILYNKWKYLFKISIVGLVLLNIILISIRSFIPAGFISRVNITKYIYEIENVQPIELYSFNNSNPFKPWGLTTNFYGQKNIRYKQIDDYRHDELNKKIKRLFVLELSDKNDKKVQKFLKDSKMKVITKSAFDPLITLYRNEKNVLVLYGENLELEYR